VDRFRSILVFAAAAAIAGCNSSSAVPQPVTAPKPIAHVVIMMQENRSFNNIFAGFPGAETALVGKCKPAKWCKTGTIALEPVKLESKTNELAKGIDIDHSHQGGGSEPGGFVEEWRGRYRRACKDLPIRLRRTL
jgi:hypothetical protein